MRGGREREGISDGKRSEIDGDSVISAGHIITIRIGTPHGDRIPKAVDRRRAVSIILYFCTFSHSRTNHIYYIYIYINSRRDFPLSLSASLVFAILSIRRVLARDRNAYE